MRVLVATGQALQKVAQERKLRCHIAHTNHPSTAAELAAANPNQDLYSCCCSAAGHHCLRMLMPARITSSTSSNWLAITGALRMICRLTMKLS